MNNFYNDVINVLKQDSRFFTENGELLRNAVYEAAMKMDSALIKMLYENETTKSRFFTVVDDIAVFDKVGFGWVINNRQFLPDSFTRYKNKIGLVDNNGEFISSSDNVVLSFPYKDCVLEGGQTKEDQKRDEIFYNETLAPNEIDRLLYPKVFTSAVRYSHNGSIDIAGKPNSSGKDCTTAQSITEINSNDNLIIKGNNLLVLSSLLKKYEGKINCIYIDPPYYFVKNKPADAFKYNSNFKLSTWLVFMKDRLKLSRRLLAKGGVLFCHMGEDGYHWLKVLASEIFEDGEFVETFVWKNTDNPDSLSNKSRSSIEYIVCFEKAKDTSKAYIGKETENGDAPLLHTGNNIHTLKFPKGKIKFNIPDEYIAAGQPDRVEIITPFNIVNGVNDKDVILKGEFVWAQDMLDEEVSKGTYFIVKSNKFSVRFQRPEGTTMAPEKYIDAQYLSKAIGVGTNEDANTHLKKLGLDFPYSKPESVIAFLIKAVTKENDIILDFFLGSGTTAAVAHKMGRRYIGVEQMDYIKDVAVERLKKVISGENGGISPFVNWQGGGSFVYCELAQLNDKYVEAITKAENDDQLKSVWLEIAKSGFISSYVSPQEIDPNADDFKSLSFDDKKRLFLALLDKNMLYVNYCDIDDETYDISEADKAFTNSFYKES